MHGDAYRMQRRPGSRHLVVNDGNSGVLVIEPSTGQEIARVAVPRKDVDAGLVEWWYFSDDGRMMAVQDERGTLTLIPLVSSVPSAVRSVELGIPQRGWPYLWDESLILADDHFRFLEIAFDGHTVQVVARPSVEIRRKHVRWRAALDRLPAGSTILRVSPDDGSLVYANSLEPPSILGILRWAGDLPEWSIPVPIDTAKSATYGDRLFVLHEESIDGWTSTGMNYMSFSPPAEFQFRDVDIIPGHETVAPMLAALCSSRDQAKADLIATYTL